MNNCIATELNTNFFNIVENHLGKYSNSFLKTQAKSSPCVDALRFGSFNGRSKRDAIYDEILA